MVPIYKDIRVKARKDYGYQKYIEPCWIAEVKRKYGLTRGHAWNWGQGESKRPCPLDLFEIIENVLRDCGAIK